MRSRSDSRLAQLVIDEAVLTVDLLSTHGVGDQLWPAIVAVLTRNYVPGHPAAKNVHDLLRCGLKDPGMMLTHTHQDVGGGRFGLSESIEVLRLVAELAKIDPGQRIGHGKPLSLIRAWCPPKQA